MSRPYLLLSLAPLFWAGNAVVGRAIAGHFPPITLSILRWSAAFIIALPFAWPIWCGTGLPFANGWAS
jgi:hypothetical protein